VGRTGDVVSGLASPLHANPAGAVPAMSNPPINQELYWESTQAMLDDLDREGPGPTEIKDSGESEGPAEFGDEYDAPISPGAAAAEDTIDVGDSADESADHLGARRPPDDAPIDLDGPSDCGEQLSTQGADTSDPGAPPDGAETPQPSADLVDQLTSTTAAGNLSVAFPTDQSLAPPGYYMLFFVSAAGVPSVASFTQLISGTPTYPPLNLGTYTGPCVIYENFDSLGDLTLDNVTQHVDLTLSSGHGSITINEKIDQHSYAKLTAATTVSIGQKIDQQSIAEITAGGDVTIGQMIDAGSQAVITSTGGKIDIGQTVNAASGATLTAATSVSIGQKIDQHSNAVIVAGTTVNIGEKIDQWSTAIITAQGDIVIGQKLDQHTNSTITSVNGSITVKQGMSGNCTATLIAPNGTITMDTIDSGCTLNWAAISLSCPHQNGTINQLP
jgi:hypothetical protein